MLDFHQKRKVRSFLYNKFTIGVLLLLVVLLGNSTWRVYKKKVDSESMKNISEQQVMELRERDDMLQEKIDRIGTEEGIEEEIRSKFSVAKENENMVLIVEDEEPIGSTTTPKRGFWAKIKSFFTR